MIRSIQIPLDSYIRPYQMTRLTIFMIRYIIHSSIHSSMIRYIPRRLDTFLDDQVHSSMIRYIPRYYTYHQIDTLLDADGVLQPPRIRDKDLYTTTTSKCLQCLIKIMYTVLQTIGVCVSMIAVDILYILYWPIHIYIYIYIYCITYIYIYIHRY